MTEDYRPTTARGFEFGIATSALQKSIRRGDEAGAVTWATELDQGGFHAYLVDRLAITCSEDIGLAWPEGPAVIGALRTSYERHLSYKKGKTGFERLFVVHAALLLARAPKSGLRDIAIWATDAREDTMSELPDVALDWFTRAGRAMGRGWQHLFTQSSHLENRSPDPTLDKRTRARFWSRYLATEEKQAGHNMVGLRSRRSDRRSSCTYGPTTGIHRGTSRSNHLKPLQPVAMGMALRDVVDGSHTTAPLHDHEGRGVRVGQTWVVWELRGEGR